MNEYAHLLDSPLAESMMLRAAAGTLAGYDGYDDEGYEGLADDELAGLGELIDETDELIADLEAQSITLDDGVAGLGAAAPDAKIAAAIAKINTKIAQVEAQMRDPRNAKKVPKLQAAIAKLRAQIVAVQQKAAAAQQKIAAKQAASAQKVAAKQAAAAAKAAARQPVQVPVSRVPGGPTTGYVAVQTPAGIIDVNITPGQAPTPGSALTNPQYGSDANAIAWAAQAAKYTNFVDKAGQPGYRNLAPIKPGQTPAMRFNAVSNVDFDSPQGRAWLASGSKEARRAYEAQQAMRNRRGAMSPAPANTAATVPADAFVVDQQPYADGGETFETYDYAPVESGSNIAADAWVYDGGAQVTDDQGAAFYDDGSGGWGYDSAPAGDVVIVDPGYYGDGAYEGGETDGAAFYDDGSGGWGGDQYNAFGFAGLGKSFFSKIGDGIKSVIRPVVSAAAGAAAGAAPGIIGAAAGALINVVDSQGNRRTVPVSGVRDANTGAPIVVRQVTPAQPRPAETAGAGINANTALVAAAAVAAAALIGGRRR